MWWEERKTEPGHDTWMLVMCRPGFFVEHAQPEKASAALGNTKESPACLPRSAQEPWTAGRLQESGVKTVGLEHQSTCSDLFSACLLVERHLICAFLSRQNWYIKPTDNDLVRGMVYKHRPSLAAPPGWLCLSVTCCALPYHHHPFLAAEDRGFPKSPWLPSHPRRNSPGSTAKQQQSASQAHTWQLLTH